MSHFLTAWSPPLFRKSSDTTILDEKLRDGDTVSVGSGTSHSTITTRVLSGASIVAASLSNDAQEQENQRKGPEPLPLLIESQLCKKLATTTVQGSGAGDDIKSASLMGEARSKTPSTISSQRISFSPTERPSLADPPQRSVSSSMASISTLRLSSVSRASIASSRSLSAGSLYHRHLYSPDFRSRTPTRDDPRFLPVRRRERRYLGNHASIERCLHYSPMMHRSISLPPLLESELSTTTSLLGEGDTSSICTGISTASGASRVSSLKLHMNGPDHTGWIKAVADYQIKEVLCSPSAGRSRLSSLSVDLEEWQLDGTNDQLAEDATPLIDKTGRKFRSSDSDRVTRGSSEVDLRDYGSEHTITKEDEEKGKEEEWERKQGAESARDTKHRKDHRPWKLVLRQRWERARNWLGFRLLSW